MGAGGYVQVEGLFCLLALRIRMYHGDNNTCITKALSHCIAYALLGHQRDHLYHAYVGSEHGVDVGEAWIT